MSTDEQINEYIAGQPEPKRGDMKELHRIILGLMPKCRLWFLDGKDDSGKTVSNPSIGYGTQTLKYANGNTREFYQIGISANSQGQRNENFQNRIVGPYGHMSSGQCPKRVASGEPR